MTTKVLTDITDKITKDGSSGYKAEKDRYHLYISKSCPFAHRARLARLLKGLQDVITVDVVDAYKTEDKGWQFTPEKEGCTADTINGKTYLKEIYLMSHPEYKGRTSVPVLFDKKTNKIVCNDSSEIARMFNSEFNEFSATKEQAALDLYPEEKRKEIDDLNSWILPNIALGVYATALSTTQELYVERVNKVFDALDKAEGILAKQRYLTGSQLTEADIKLFVSLVRFDSVYYPLLKNIKLSKGIFPHLNPMTSIFKFSSWDEGPWVHNAILLQEFFTPLKCNKKQIRDYPHLWAFVCDIYEISDVATTVNLPEIKESYYTGAMFTAYRGIIPIGPDIDFTKKDPRK